MLFLFSDLLLGCSIPILILVHLYFSPYTKVEESFNLQAVHDILKYGVPSNSSEQFKQEYDHFSFPGAVPRTFVGALILSGTAKPFLYLYSHVNKQLLGMEIKGSVILHIKYLLYSIYIKPLLLTVRKVRAILGLFNAFALLSYVRGIRRAFGKVTAVWYILFQASQFHVIYYASRPLPNMFAFGISMY